MKTSRARSPERRSVPSFRDLSRADCDRILARNHVGRVAFTFHDRVDIEPIHYVYADGWLHGRTAPGSKIVVLKHHPWVAFEVDEVNGLFDWRSVVVHGVVHMPDPDGSLRDQDAYASTLTHVRSLVPDALSVGDPTPHRILAFRIHIDDVTGRSSSTKLPAGSRQR